MSRTRRKLSAECVRHCAAIMPKSTLSTAGLTQSNLLRPKRKKPGASWDFSRRITPSPWRADFMVHAARGSGEFSGRRRAAYIRRRPTRASSSSARQHGGNIESRYSAIGSDGQGLVNRPATDMARVMNAMDCPGASANWHRSPGTGRLRSSCLRQAGHCVRAGWHPRSVRRGRLRQAGAAGGRRGAGSSDDGPKQSHGARRGSSDDRCTQKSTRPFPWKGEARDVLELYRRWGRGKCGKLRLTSIQRPSSRLRADTGGLASEKNSLEEVEQSLRIAKAAGGLSPRKKRLLEILPV